MKAYLFINEKSGGVQKQGVDAIIAQTSDILRRYDPYDLEVVSGDFTVLVNTAKTLRDQDNIAYFIIAGGDGTQAAIASVIRHTPIALLPLPCGTVNELCRDLDIPLTINEALDACLSGSIRLIDVGIIGERVFLNNVVFGAYATLAEARETLRDAETITEVTVGVANGAEAILKAEPMRFRVEIDDSTLHLDTNTIVVSNNIISRAENLVPKRDRIDEGMLAVYLSEASHGGDFTALLAEFVASGAQNAAQIDIQKCKHCKIMSVEPMFSYTIDGDPVESSKPVSIDIDAKSLRVAAP